MSHLRNRMEQPRPSCMQVRRLPEINSNTSSLSDMRRFDGSSIATAIVPEESPDPFLFVTMYHVVPIITFTRTFLKVELQI